MWEKNGNVAEIRKMIIGGATMSGNVSNRGSKVQNNFFFSA